MIRTKCPSEFGNGLHTTAASSHTDLSSHEQGSLHDTSTGDPTNEALAMERGWKRGSEWCVLASDKVLGVTPEIGASLSMRRHSIFSGVGFRSSARGYGDWPKMQKYRA